MDIKHPDIQSEDEPWPQKKGFKLIISGPNKISYFNKVHLVRCLGLRFVKKPDTSPVKPGYTIPIIIFQYKNLTSHITMKF